MGNYIGALKFFLIVFISLFFNLSVPSTYAESKPVISTHLKQGNLLFCQAKYDEAIAEFEKAVAENPDDVYANTNLAYTYYITEQHDKALKQWERVTQISPNNGIAYDFLIELKAEHEVHNEVSNYFGSIGECYTDKCTEALENLRARRIDVDPNYDVSIKIYENASMQDFANGIARHLLAMSFYNKGWDELAMYHIKKSIESAPFNYLALYSQAKLYLSLSSTNNAINVLKTLIAVNPKYFNAKIMLAGLYSRYDYYGHRKYDEAEKIYTQLLSDGAEKESVYNGMANLYFHRMFYEWNRLKPEEKFLLNKNYMEKIAEFWSKSGNIQFTKLKEGKISVRHVNLFLGSIDLLFMAKNFKKGEEYEKSQSRESFLEVLKEIIAGRISKGEKGILEDAALIVINLADGKYEDATKIAKKISEDVPALSLLYDKLLGDIHFEREEYLQAVQYYLRVDEKEPKWRNINFLIASCYRKLGKDKDALPYLQKAYDEAYYTSVQNTDYEILETLGIIPLFRLEQLVAKENNGTPVGGAYCDILKVAGYSCSAIYLQRIKKPESKLRALLKHKKVIISANPSYRNFQIVTDYVENGGKVLFIVGKPPTFNYDKNLMFIGMELSTMTSFGGRNNLEWIKVAPESTFPIFNGLNEFYVNGDAVELIPGEDATVLAKVGDAPIIVEKKYGKGKIIVAGIGTQFDDTVWKKKDEKIVRSRLKLLLNMVAYLAKD